MTTFKSAQRAIFFVLLFGVTILFLWMIRSFLFPIFWAAILAVIFYPLHRQWLKLTRQRRFPASMLTIFSIVIIVLVPLMALGNAVVHEAVSLYDRIDRGQATIESTIDNINEVVPVEQWLEQAGFDRTDLRQQLSDRLQTGSRWLFTKATTLGQNAVRFFVNTFLMLYVLYYFLKSGPELLVRIRRYLPIGDRKEVRLFKKFSSTARATLKGSIVIGLVQGAIGWGLFTLVGINAAVLWAAIIALLSLVPAVGSFIIWAPVGLYLLLVGQVWEGITVLAVGTLVISTVDNILRPPLIGKDTKMPDALVLLSTLGGIMAFGLSGFILGPIIAAFFLALWEMFDEDYHQELTESG